MLRGVCVCFVRPGEVKLAAWASCCGMSARESIRVYIGNMVVW